MRTKNNFKLLIVESPAKAHTISKYAGKDYVVKASVGHIRDLPKSNKKAIDIEGGFIPHYEISPGKEKVVAELRALAKDADEVILATDPDREGEAIAWHLKETIGLKKPKRIAFHEITENAVKEALEHPRQIDDNLRQAQEARRVLDRLVGYDLSGLIWKKVRYGLSAGRVQSPALRIIMEREREIRAFIPQIYWVLTAQTETQKKVALTLECEEKPETKERVEKILALGKSKDWIVADLTEAEAKRSPKAPFTTSTLQQSASSRLGFAPSRTMGIAQKLYESGLITYMRTDSTNLSKEALPKIHALIAKDFGNEYVSPRVFTKKSKNAQEAHEAIRPTDISKDHIGNLNTEQEKLYRLIRNRVLACQMADAKISRTKVSVNIGDKEEIIFSANGNRIIFPGWLAAETDARGEEVELPAMTVGEKLKLLDLTDTQKSTEPPAHYSEAGLIKELEKRGIGRPSTYASIIKTIQDRGYVEKQEKALHPTDTGEVVSDFLEKNFAEYISDTFTAEMEDKLDFIAEGKAEYLKTLKDFYGPFLKDVKAKEKSDKITSLGDADAKWKCPKCQGPMIIKLGRSGKFLSCAKYPDCDGARTITGEEMTGPKDTGELCPQCGKANLVERDGKFGRFVACANYPKCKFIKKDLEAEKLNSTGVKCPKCKDGLMTQKRGRFGFFYSCTNYPDCKYIIKSKPTGEICKLCGDLMMVGTKTIPDRCSNKLCANNRPDKLEK
ncbi:MAG: type I DNA topoisomerase [bacterium]